MQQGRTHHTTGQQPAPDLQDWQLVQELYEQPEQPLSHWQLVPRDPSGWRQSINLPTGQVEASDTDVPANRRRRPQSRHCQLQNSDYQPEALSDWQQMQNPNRVPLDSSWVDQPKINLRKGHVGEWVVDPDLPWQQRRRAERRVNQTLDREKNQAALKRTIKLFQSTKPAGAEPTRRRGLGQQLARRMDNLW